MLREIRWGEEITGLTISEKFNQFREIMLGAEEECIPYGEGGNRQTKPPCFKGEARRSVRRKFFTYMRYRETGSYARYRVYVREKEKNKKVLKKTRKAFAKKLYKEVKKNPKALYRYINAKKGNRTPITKLRQRNGMNTSNDREAAEELNEFFQSVFVKEEDKDIIAFNNFARLRFETEVAEPFDFVTAPLYKLSVRISHCHKRMALLLLMIR